MEISFQFERANQKSLRDHAYESIKRAILRGDFPAGTRLREAEIAQQMGVSRGPIREAFSLLAQEGLICSHPYRETVVAEISSEETEEVYVPMRRTIELYVSLRAKERLTEQDFEELEKIVEKMDEASCAQNLELLTDLDLSFHTFLISKIASVSLQNLWSGIVSRIHVRLLCQGLTHEDLRCVSREHSEFLTLLKEGDLEKLTIHLDAHIR